MENDINEKDIQRLNYLYNKSTTTTPLTYNEQEEQGLLRQKLLTYFINVMNK